MFMCNVGRRIYMDDYLTPQYKFFFKIVKKENKKYFDKNGSETDLLKQLLIQYLEITGCINAHSSMKSISSRGLIGGDSDDSDEDNEFYGQVPSYSTFNDGPEVPTTERRMEVTRRLEDDTDGAPATRLIDVSPNQFNRSKASAQGVVYDDNEIAAANALPAMSSSRPPPVVGTKRKISEAQVTVFTIIIFSFHF